MIYILSLSKNKGQIMMLIAISVFVELAYINYNSVNDRDCITKIESLQKVGYNDYTVEAIDYLKGKDKGFFRVNKDYTSGPAIHTSFNDAKAQGYFGTMSYYSFNQKYYIHFLEETEVIHKGNESESRWAPGLSGRPLLQIFGSIKYNLSKSPKPGFMQMGYDSIIQVGDVKILQNHYFLPLGFSYDKFIPFSKYQKLSTLQKELVLLQAVVAEEPLNSEYNQLKEFSLSDTIKIPTWVEIDKNCRARRKDTLIISYFSNSNIKGTIDVNDSRLLFFSIPFDRGWNATIDHRKVKPTLCNLGFSGLLLSSGHHSIELYYKPPYFNITLVISLVSILLYIGLILIDMALKKRRQKALKTSEPIFSGASI